MSKLDGLTRREAAAALAAAGLSAWAYPDVALAQGSSILRVRSYADIQVLDPLHRKAQPEGDVMRCIYSGLVARKGGDVWAYDLDAAEVLKQLDAKTIVFRLKPGIMFTNGFGEMTAEDVKFSYERIANPEMKSPYKTDWAVLDQVEITDKYSGIIHLKSAFAPLWASTLPAVSGLIVSKKAVESVGGKFETKVPASSGRYVIKDWQPKQRLTLARNPDWKGIAAAFDEIHILPIEDEKTAEIGFEARNLDYTWVSVTSIARYKKDTPKGTKFVVKPSLAFVWMGMNVDAPPFDKPAVRRAVQHAINVEGVLDAAYFGAAEPSTGIIAPGLPGNRKKVTYGYDKSKALALLKDAGLEKGFACTLDILNKTERLNAAQAIQAQLAEVNIKVTINQHDSGTYWSLGDQTKGDRWKSLQLVLQRYSMQPDPSWATAWFVPEQVGVWNWERWNNAEFGDLHQKGLVEQDAAKRAEIYERMQTLMEESGAYVFLTHESVGVAWRDAVQPALEPAGIPLLASFAKA